MLNLSRTLRTSNLQHLKLEPEPLLQVAAKFSFGGLRSRVSASKLALSLGFKTLAEVPESGSHPTLLNEVSSEVPPSYAPPYPEP